MVTELRLLLLQLLLYVASAMVRSSQRLWIRHSRQTERVWTTTIRLTLNPPRPSDIGRDSHRQNTHDAGYNVDILRNPFVSLCLLASLVINTSPRLVLSSIAAAVNRVVVIQKFNSVMYAIISRALKTVTPMVAYTCHDGADPNLPAVPLVPLVWSLKVSQAQ